MYCECCANRFECPFLASGFLCEYLEEYCEEETDRNISELIKEINNEKV